MTILYKNKVKATASFLLLAVLALVAGCSHIDGDEQLIKTNDLVIPTEYASGTAKNVLIEDFTGQRCSNCPKGTEVIEQLQAAYGDDRVIAVGIHSGPFGKLASGSLLPLTTETGCEYYDLRGVESQPGAHIDRRGSILYKVEDWIGRVQEDLGQTAKVGMELQAAISGEKIDITLTATGYGSYSGKLQVWVIEDGITAAQTLPDGSTKRDYVHNHVFRAAVNGIWGDDFSIAADESLTQSLTMPVDAAWNSSKLSIVAFVYNDGGVEQTVKGRVKSEE